MNDALLFDELVREPVEAPPRATARAPAAVDPSPEAVPAQEHADADGAAQILLIVPPFASIWYPGLGVHVLQACARAAGYEVDVLYANLLLASLIGVQAYEQITAESISLAAERFFARSAFDLPPLGHGADQAFAPERIYGRAEAELCRDLYPDSTAATLGASDGLSPEAFMRLEPVSVPWVDEIARQIVERGYKVVGASTTFQQTTASLALLRRIKALSPDTITLLGGANCEGEMAEGLVALERGVDFVFSGESETAFPEFIRSIMSGVRPADRIVRGSPCQNMDALPMLSYREFFAQRSDYLGSDSAESDKTSITYETSRGCWWGEKQHCTFCGLNGEGMAFRKKSPGRVLEELRHLLRENPTRNVTMADNIMPHEYFKTLLPRLRREFEDVEIFYEQKANLAWNDVTNLKDSGISVIQPGIEALSTGLLKLMRKGVNARQNLMLLRYARIAGVRVVWNIICGFPNDLVRFYEETLELVPLIAHLQPPNGVFHLSIERFSPYFTEPELHGVSNVRPLPVYRDFLPAGADTRKIAYHFQGDYTSDTHKHIDVVRALYHAVQVWLASWNQAQRPELKVARRDGRFWLVDTRGLPETTPLAPLSVEDVTLLLNARRYGGTDRENQLVSAKLAVLRDEWFVPLAVVKRELFEEFSQETRERDAVDNSGLAQIRSRPSAADAAGRGDPDSRPAS